VIGPSQHDIGRITPARGSRSDKLAVATLGVLLRWRPNPTWLIAAGATVGLLRGWLS
jgi:hypothetical protein